MRLFILTSLTAVMFLFSGALYAQQKTLSGTVTDAITHAPLPGATVTVQGKSVLTDLNGKFTVLFTPGASITFSYVGYNPQTFKQTQSTDAFVVGLMTGQAGLDQVVVTGYQTQRKVDLTGSVAVVNLNDIKDIPNENPMVALQGRVPGLYVTGDGDPGSGNTNVVIRGFNTLGFNNPLYVIDGVPTILSSVFQSLDPNSIQTIQVLKDASASTIYGSRASNGVIIVTTKQGANGKVRMQLSTSATMEKFATKEPVLSTQGYGRAIWQAAINDGDVPNSETTLFTFGQSTGPNGQPVLNTITPFQYLNGDSTEPTANTDWQNQVFKTGWIESNDLVITSGTEHSNLLIDLNYLDNSSIMRFNPYRRYGARVNAETSLFNDKLKIGNNLQFFQQTETPVPSDLGGASVLYDTKFVSPLIPVYTTTGAYAGPSGAGFSDRDNPLMTLYLSRWNTNGEFNIFGNLFGELTPIKHLVIRSSLGYMYDNVSDRQILPEYSDGFISRTVNSLTLTNNHELDLTWSNTATYHLEFGKSRLDILGGMEAITRSYITGQDYKQGFAIQTNNYFQLSAGTGIATTNGTTTGDRLLSYFGKLNYSWSDKWLASVTLRDDESSRFGANVPYGLFPAGSIGWRIINEPFMKNIDWISDLKLRSGYGVTGNQQSIGDYASMALYATNYGTVGQTGSNQNTGAYGNNGTAYNITGSASGNLPSGYVQVQAANPNLKWESTAEFNEGVDYAFLHNTIFGSFDYFSRKTTNIIVQPPYAAILGEGAEEYVNGATKTNKGWEFVLGYQNHAGKLSYSVTGNLFSFRDKITYLPSTVVAAYPGDVQQTILGHSDFSEFGYQVQGLYQSQQEIASHAYQPGAGLGRLMYKAVTGDDTISANDQTWLGTAMPKFNYGMQINLGYGAWSFSLFLQGIAGGVETNSNKENTDFLGLNPGVNIGQRALSAWTASNTKSNIPALSLVDNNDEERFSSYYVESSSYLKIRNAQIGYTIPKKTVAGLKAFDGIKVYLMGQNLATFYKKSGANAFSDKDPENPGGNYPIPRKITAGVNLSF